MIAKLFIFSLFVTSSVFAEFRLNQKYEGFLLSAEESIGKYMNHMISAQEAQKEIDDLAKNSTSFYKGLVDYLQNRNSTLSFKPIKPEDLPKTIEEAKSEYEVELSKAVKETKEITAKGQEAQSRLAKLGRKGLELIKKVARATLTAVLAVASAFFGIQVAIFLGIISAIAYARSLVQ